MEALKNKQLSLQLLTGIQTQSIDLQSFVELNRHFVYDLLLAQFALRNGSASVEELRAHMKITRCFQIEDFHPLFAVPLLVANISPHNGDQCECMTIDIFNYVCAIKKCFFR